MNSSYTFLYYFIMTIVWLFFIIAPWAILIRNFRAITAVRLELKKIKCIVNHLGERNDTNITR